MNYVFAVLAKRFSTGFHSTLTSQRQSEQRGKRRKIMKRIWQLSLKISQMNHAERRTFILNLLSQCVTCAQT